jgi:hypothetical protein
MLIVWFIIYLLTIFSRRRSPQTERLRLSSVCLSQNSTIGGIASGYEV